jgi:transposase
VKRETLHLSQHQTIETGLDWNGRYFVAYSSGASVFIRDRKELVRWLKVPKSIPMRSSLDSWLDSLDAYDQERVSKKAEPLTSEAPVEQTSPSLSQELLATGFGPECHDDDPALSTKMVI